MTVLVNQCELNMQRSARAGCWLLALAAIINGSCKKRVSSGDSALFASAMDERCRGKRVKNQALRDLAFNIF
jgi:hypothetical protein